MILLVDSGNSRVKWRLVNGAGENMSGAGLIDEPGLFADLSEFGADIDSIEVSAVGSEQSCQRLSAALDEACSAPVYFHWAEKRCSGLVNSYGDTARMGADRWHAMVAGWQHCHSGFAVIDAGSAVTVDYVAINGRHIGGYILPGMNMLRRSLRLDVARVGFDDSQKVNTVPGTSTTECVNHGLDWLSQSIAHRVARDADEYGLGRIYVTGGDGFRFVRLGLVADYWSGMVLDGLYEVALGAISARRG